MTHPLLRRKAHWCAKKVLLWLALGMLSVGANAQTDSIRDISDRIAFGHRVANRPDSAVDVIVIHSSYYVGRDSFSTAGVIREYAHYHVAPHYLIERNGQVIRMVAEQDVAWHAGKSMLPASLTDSAGTMQGGVNSRSIGIEIINTRSQGPTEKQYEALAALLSELCGRHPIRCIVGHSTIAPGRKTDPWAFDWERLREMLPELRGIIAE